jgi:thiamine biosynthesis protein ThiI
LFTQRISGSGGLPVGVEGRVVALIEEEKDLLAALLMMKRGCAVIPVLLKAASTELLEQYGGRERAISIKKISEADEIAEQSGAKAVVVSQTLENFSELKMRTAVLRPLIAYNEDEINEQLENFRRKVC